MQYYKTEGLGALLRLSLILFTLAFVLTGILFAYKGVLGRQLGQQKQLLSDLQVQFEPSLIAQLERVANSINNARTLLKSHVYATPILDFLEKNTMPEVAYSTMNYAGDKKSLLLNGDAPSYTDVSAQIKIFAAQPEVASASFSNTTLRDAGSVGFNATINFR